MDRTPRGVGVDCFYWGGHGAATSSGTLFEELGIEGMLSVGLILATLGLIVAMVVGINYGQHETEEVGQRLCRCKEQGRCCQEE